MYIVCAKFVAKEKGPVLFVRNSCEILYISEIDYLSSKLSTNTWQHYQKAPENVVNV
jgi:hypothetical protein